MTIDFIIGMSIFILIVSYFLLLSTKYNTCKFRIKHSKFLDSSCKETNAYIMQIKLKYFPFWQDYGSAYDSEKEVQDKISIAQKRESFGTKVKIIYPDAVSKLMFDDPEEQKAYEDTIKAFNSIKKTLKEMEKSL